MKRRIEITRERWTRFRLQLEAPSCPHCLAVGDWTALDHAPQILGIPADRINGAARSGRIGCRLTPSAFLVCVHCLRRLIAGNEL